MAELGHAPRLHGEALVQGGEVELHKELTFPFACMTKDQRDFLFGLLGYDDASVTWNRLVCLGFFFFDPCVWQARVICF